MRRRCCSPRTTTWSTQSRRRVPITRSQYGFCHGERGAVSTCSIPIACTVGQLGAFGRALQDGQQLSQGEVFESELPLRLQARSGGRE